MFVDTHTHLYAEEFALDRVKMLDDAFRSGVKNLIMPSISQSSTELMLQLNKAYPANIFMMMGLHPCYVKTDSWKSELEWVELQLQSGLYCAVGEIGIDLYWDKSTLAIQQEAFRIQIKWAIEYDLPINIHCREAFNEVFEILEEMRNPKLRGVFHCFTGTEEQARQAIDLQMKLGIGGVVTFKNGLLDTFLHRIDPANLVLETDAPYLAPVPYRGKRNESAYIPLIAKKLAEIYNMTIEEIAQITSEQALKLFGLED
jgi:TatD DNase family protein